MGGMGVAALPRPLDRAPDYVEPAHGWRVWDVVAADDGFRLSSLCFRTIWAPHEPKVAVCRRSALNEGPRPGHQAPDLDCSCGIYAVDEPRRALGYLSRLFRGSPWTLHRVVGPVALWGTAVQCARGWRASYAYPRAIYVPTGRWSVRSALHGVWRPSCSVDRIADELGVYGVRVEVVDAGTARELAPLLAARAC
jgi:hypothetical protein